MAVLRRADMRRVCLGLAVMVVLVASSGCMICRAEGAIGTGYDAGKVEELVVGQTTREQVIELFGPEYIQEASPDIIRFERIRLKAAARWWGCSYESNRDGIRVQFKDGVVAGYQIIGGERPTAVRAE
jgi:hypothetical protein